MLRASYLCSQREIINSQVKNEDRRCTNYSNLQKYNKL